MAGTPALQLCIHFDARHCEPDRFQVRGEQICLLCRELDQRWAHPCPVWIVAVNRNRLLQRRNHGAKCSAAEHLTHDI